MRLTLHYDERAQRPICAAFLRGSEPAAWLRELGRWGVAAAQLRCYLVPESIHHPQPAGLLVVAAEDVALPADVLEPYGVVAGRLYVPTHARLWPATTPQELGAALLWPRQLLHPSIGLVGFADTDELDLATLLDCGPPRPTDWGMALAVEPPKPRLHQVRVLAPTAEQVVQAIQQEVGTVPLEQLPGPAPAGAVRRLLDSAQRRLLTGLLSIVQVLRGFFGARPFRVLGGVAAVAIGVGLLLVLVKFLFSEGGQAMGLVFMVLCMVLARIIQHFSDRADSGTTYQPVRPGRGSGTGSAGGSGAGFGVLQKLEQWLGGNLKDLEQKRNNEIERLLRLFGENPEEALRYAIPLGSPYADRGIAPPSARLGPRSTNFSLNNLGGGRGVDSWNLNDYRFDLQQRYEAAARQEAQAGRYQKAAYIHAHLLGNFLAAAQALEQGGLYREAAALYKDHLKNLPAAAQCLENGGLLLEAVALYDELQQHEKAGDLYQQLDQPELAARHYERSVEVQLGNQDHLDAARILNDKLGYTALAQKILLDGWADSRQAENCLKQYFTLAAAESEPDLCSQVNFVYQRHTPAKRRVALLQVLAAVNEQHPNAELLATSRDVAYEVVSAEAAAGNTAPLALLRHFLPTDRLLAADVSRYATGRQKHLRDALPTSPASFQLDATITWLTATSHGMQWVVIGQRGNQLHLARCNWYGNVEYYSWPSPIDPGLRVVLVADERYSTRILVRPSRGVILDTKVLSKNKYFAQSLTVECPPWLPEWPTRLALLPNGNIITMSLQEGGKVQALTSTSPFPKAQTYDLTEIAPSFVAVERGWPCELFEEAGRYYSYWNQWLVILEELGPYLAYELSSVVVQLARSPYSARLQVAISTQHGLRIWNPLAPGEPYDQEPDPELETTCAANMDLRFVGPEHVAVVDEQAAELYHLVPEGPRLVRSFESTGGFLAALPTADRKQFALLEESGKVTLYPLGEG
ncbi:hypothetical protein [Hymenobacter cellulosivorans]|uniref:MoxR-vWA-beta-propeller ternary system domain-containing protein n=1 Tax=Hymenobacter cellulosivorans TaxID=2932249 RepID=A0ABY4F4Y7_9BACT|nr:hypothetical protein [Hymenobacter cellulosivorans]UOQ51207.1 hypothetical protein MUN80_15705 [Hymenobacter cellulosivorans]